MLKTKSNVNIPGVDTLMEQEPFTEHGKEDSKLVFSWDDAITASTQGIPGVYWTAETIEILFGEFAPVKEKGVFLYIDNQYFK